MPAQDTATSETQRIVLVTGPAGAGRMTAINVLEDLGYEAIDNLPLTMIPRLIDGLVGPSRPVALGLDTRNRDFSAEGLLQLYTSLSADAAVAVDLLYLDCSAEVLERRYSETRRRHPLAPSDAPRDGIERELVLLEDLRHRADIVIDTTQLSPHDLREAMEPWFHPPDAQRMALSLHSFSYKRGLPQGLDMAFDCRFLQNPHWQQDLRAHTGLNPDVRAFIEADARYAPFLEHLLGLIRFVLPEAVAEGKAHLSLGFGCTGGKHRSVAVTEAVSRALTEDGWILTTRHRELDRMQAVAARTGPVRDLTAGLAR